MGADDETRALAQALARIAELEARNGELQALFDGVLGQLPVILFRLDAEGAFTESIGAGLRRLGLEDGQVVGMNALDAYPKSRDALLRALAGETTTWVDAGTTPDGESWSFVTYATFDRARGSGLIAFSIDVTDRLRAEQELRRREAELRTLVEQSPDHITRIDRDGRILFINYTAEGVAAEAVLGQPIWDFAAAESVEPMRAAIAEIFRTGTPQQLDTRAVIPPAFEAQFSVRITPILQEGEGNRPSDVSEAMVIATDITERKRIEAREARMQLQLQQTQKLESLGLLSGGIAHDFNNLLIGVLGNASLAAADEPTGSANGRRLAQIMEAARRASELCQQLLAYSGKGRFIVRPVDLSEIVHSTARLFEVSIPKSVSIVYGCEPGAGAVLGDVTQLRQVIMNLVVNAAESIEAHGTVHVRTGTHEYGADYLATTYIDDPLEAGAYAYLEVTDNGRGMDEQTRAQLFDPFFTTKETGRGLGMAAVLGIVRGHKGAIRVDTRLGQGTTFRVLFPVTDAPSEPLDRPDAPAVAPRGRGTVLVIDDEPMVLSLIGEILDSAGFEVMLASGGSEGLSIFREARDRIVLVVLDLTMPQMSGEEVFRRLRELAPGLPVLLSSGYDEHDSISRFVGDGPAGFIQKPYSADELRQRVLESLAGKP